MTDWFPELQRNLEDLCGVAELWLIQLHMQIKYSYMD
jgi:hypothetical protein